MPPTNGAQFVRTCSPPLDQLGLGKLLGINNNIATLEFFDTPGSSTRITFEVPSEDLQYVDLPPQTRVYRILSEGQRWQVGRVIDGSSGQIQVQFPNKEIVELPPEELHVRWQRAVEDPVAFLAQEITETPRFSEARSAFMKAVIKQRAACLGMGAVLSSQIDLVDYQFEVVRRILQDPVQRYLLADEVGLGKTIEAGLLIRQYMLDAALAARALVVAPPSLVDQWRTELTTRFGLAQSLDQTLHVISSDDLHGIRRHINEAGMLVVDEAHHLSSGTSEFPPALYALLQQHAHVVPKLLLLSATPVLADTAGFLRILNLLDPVVFNLDDLPGFEQRIQGRQLVAEVAAALVPENLMILGSELERLEATFGQDPVLCEHVERLRNVIATFPSEDDPELADNIAHLKAHLTETYRLHRRILRNRRKSVPWATPQRDGLWAHRFTTSGSAERWSALEALRVHLANMEQIPPERTGPLLICAVHPHSRLNCEAWVRHEGIHDEPSMELARAVDHLSREICDGGFRLRAALEAVYKLLATPQQQVVLFCDQEVDADRFYSLICSERPGIARRHATSVTRDGRQRMGVRNDWETFLTDPTTCRVLVCDSRAEEGLNLQGGRKVAVHFDLPAAANRLEQRMGRLDRFGTGDPVRSVVIVDTGNPAESAWLQFLNEGLEVFDQSMASLQYLVEESGRELVIQWLGEGVQALMDKTARLTGPQGLVVRERQRIEQQDMLDSLCEPPTAAFDTLERVDGEWRSWSESFNRFAVDALQLSQRSVAWEGVLDPGNQVFRMGYSLGAGRPTLISLPSFIQEFRDSIDKEADGFHYRNPLTSAYSFKRSTCRTKEGRRLGVRPLRYGDEFVRGLVSFCETDDRGRSFAMWRNFPKYQNVDGCGADLYFRFDFLVEANIDTESSREFGPESFRILRRRADGYLPPEYVSVWVSADGVASENAPEEARLPYRPKTQEGMEGRDFNLNPTRWKALHSQSRFPWLREWPELCAIARRSAQVYVESLPRVRELITSGLQASRQQHIVRQAQVSSRISRLNGVARIAEEQELEKEEKLQALLGSALVKPSLKLDVAGAVFLSSRFGFRS